MPNIYSSSLVKQRKRSFSPKQKSDEELLRTEIARDFSAYCTKALLTAVQQMNKDITRFVIADLVSKGLK